MRKSCFILSVVFFMGLLVHLYMLIHTLTGKTKFLLHALNLRLGNNHFQYLIDSDGLSSFSAHLLPRDEPFYYNHTSYDFYSVHDIGQSKPHSLWKKFSLDTLRQYPSATSQSGLAFVETIMVITGKHLKDRHEHLENVFLHQGIPKSAIEYRWKWTKQNCADANNSIYIKSIFPYSSGDHTKDVACATVIEHVDAWYSIADRNISFALIVEDDVAFVPFLKEKFNRFMSEAVKRKLIRVNKNQASCAGLVDSGNLTMDQLLRNPTLTEGIFHFGKCLKKQSPGLNPYSLSEVPRFTPFRGYHHGRCSHMYAMTHCGAKMMINTLHKFPTRYQWIDWLTNYIITKSPRLIGWWTDPPLGYQTSQIEVVGELHSSLKQKTYDPFSKADTP